MAIATEVRMIDCTESTISEGGPACVSSGEADLGGIARYLALAVAGEVITLEAAAAALIEWTAADNRALKNAAARSDAGSVAESVLNIAAAAHPRAA